MADIKGEPPTLLKSRLEFKSMELQLQLARCAVRRGEIQFELEKMDDNEALLKKAIADIKKELATLSV